MDTFLTTQTEESIIWRIIKRPLELIKRLLPQRKKQIYKEESDHIFTEGDVLSKNMRL